MIDRIRPIPSKEPTDVTTRAGDMAPITVVNSFPYRSGASGTFVPDTGLLRTHLRWIAFFAILAGTSLADGVYCQALFGKLPSLAGFTLNLSVLGYGVVALSGSARETILTLRQPWQITVSPSQIMIAQGSIGHSHDWQQINKIRWNAVTRRLEIYEKNGTVLRLALIGLNAQQRQSLRGLINNYWALSQK